MKSFIEYMEFREAEDAVYNTVRDTYRKYSGWKLRKADQGNLDTQAIASLQAVIDYMKKSDDAKIKGLYNGGYAGELYTLSQWFQGKEDPRYAQHAQDAQNAQNAQEEGFVGGAVGAAAGLAMGGIPGAVWGGIAGHYGQKAWNFATGPMRELNNLENQAMKALQAVVNRLNYEKGEKYHNGFAQRLQGWVTRMKEMQQFNNQPRKSEIAPKQGWTYKKVYNRPATPPSTRPRTATNAPATNTPNTPNTPNTDRWN